MDQAINALRAAGEPTRLRILALLRQSDLAVGELVHVLGQSQPRLSHHLKTLASAGLVERMPEGSWVFYRLPAPGPHRHFLDTLFEQTDMSGSDFLRDAGQLAAVQSARRVAADDYFDRVAGTWDTVRSLHYPNEAIEQTLLDLAGAGPFRRLIDLGTGTGRMLTLLAPHAASAEGLDLSHQMLTVARANLEDADLPHARVRQGDVAATPFETASADLVVLHQVLHFIDAPERVLAEAARILIPGGRLLIVDFAPHTLDFLREEHGHRRLGVRPDNMEIWADAAGLSVQAPLRFDPPASARDGLSVLIWTIQKPATQKEAAA